MRLQPLLNLVVATSIVKGLASASNHGMNLSEPNLPGRNVSSLDVSQNTFEDNEYNFLAPLIVGGWEVKPKDRYPYQVAIYKERYYGKPQLFCGGSLITSLHVLCAAHCAGDSIIIQIGRWKVTNNTEVYEERNIEKQFIHPNYNSNNYENDFVVFELDSPITNFGPVQVNSLPHLPVDGETLHVMGWGTTSNNGLVSNTLLETTVGYIKNSQCSKSFSSEIIFPSMLCAKSPGQDACKGDSGGPLIIKSPNSFKQDLLVGVVSWGSGCANAYYPGVYARVSQAYQWIEGIVCSGDAIGPMCGNVVKTSQPSISSSTPTSLLSLSPSVAPSLGHSFAPSSILSSIPSSIPSAVPSIVPSSIPSSLPSLRPSGVPNLSHSFAPSSILSSIPSPIPSTVPSVAPSYIPSSAPSLSSPPTSVPVTTSFAPTRLNNEIVRISFFKSKRKSINDEKWQVILKFKLRNSSNKPSVNTILKIGFNGEERTRISNEKGKCTFKIFFGKQISSVSFRVTFMSAPNGEVYKPEKNIQKKGCSVFSTRCPTRTVKKK